jgi:hypothetical protein
MRLMTACPGPTGRGHVVSLLPAPAARPARHDHRSWPRYRVVCAFDESSSRASAPGEVRWWQEAALVERPWRQARTIFLVRPGQIRRHSLAGAVVTALEVPGMRVFCGLAATRSVSLSSRGAVRCVFGDQRGARYERAFWAGGPCERQLEAGCVFHSQPDMGRADAIPAVDAQGGPARLSGPPKSGVPSQPTAADVGRQELPHTEPHRVSMMEAGSTGHGGQGVFAPSSSSPTSSAGPLTQAERRARYQPSRDGDRPAELRNGDWDALRSAATAVRQTTKQPIDRQCRRPSQPVDHSVACSTPW